MDKELERATDEPMRVGSTQRHGRGLEVQYRFIAETDDINAITELLHRAYAPLAEAGLRYVASHQSADVTRRRLDKGDTIVAVADGGIVGTVTLARTSSTMGSPFYDRPDVASFGQFGVVRCFKGMASVRHFSLWPKTLAVERGVGELALDTSEQAEHLLRFYTSRGYRFVEFVRWPDVNYRSMILAKALASASQEDAI